MVIIQFYDIIKPTRDCYYLDISHLINKVYRRLYDCYACIGYIIYKRDIRESYKYLESCYLSIIL